MRVKIYEALELTFKKSTHNMVKLDDKMGENLGDIIRQIDLSREFKK